MVKRYRRAPSSTFGVSTSEFRRRLAHYIGAVRYGGDFVVIHRKGEDSVYLISQADWDLLGKKILDMDSGKWDPELRVRHSGLWDLLNCEWRQATYLKMQEWWRNDPEPTSDWSKAPDPRPTSGAKAMPGETSRDPLAEREE